MREEEKPEQPFTRFSAYTFLLVGYALSAGVGPFLSAGCTGLHERLDDADAREVTHTKCFFTLQLCYLIPDLVVYPPIAGPDCLTQCRR